MTRHELKCWPEPYIAACQGLKPWEIRKNDRDYRSGDELLLQQWDPAAKKYLGREQLFKVTYIMYGGPHGQFGIPADHCIMSIVPL